MHYMTKTFWVGLTTLGLMLAPLLAAAAGPTYSVPFGTDPTVATFAAPDASLTYKDGRYLLRYTLPVDLYGTPDSPIRVSLTSLAGQVDPYGFIELTDGNSNAGCEVDQSRVMCVIHYSFSSYSRLDPDVATRYLKQKYAQDPKLSKRITVARDFISDPAGILVISK